MADQCIAKIKRNFSNGAVAGSTPGGALCQDRDVVEQTALKVRDTQDFHKPR